MARLDFQTVKIGVGIFQKSPGYEVITFDSKVVQHATGLSGFFVDQQANIQTFDLGTEAQIQSDGRTLHVSVSFNYTSAKTTSTPQGEWWVKVTVLAWLDDGDGFPPVQLGNATEGQFSSPISLSGAIIPSTSQLPAFLSGFNFTLGSQDTSVYPSGHIANELTAKAGGIDIGADDRSFTISESNASIKGSATEAITKLKTTGSGSNKTTLSPPSSVNMTGTASTKVGYCVFGDGLDIEFDTLTFTNKQQNVLSPNNLFPTHEVKTKSAVFAGKKIKRVALIITGVDLGAEFKFNQGFTGHLPPDSTSFTAQLLSNQLATIDLWQDADFESNQNIHNVTSMQYYTEGFVSKTNEYPLKIFPAYFRGFANVTVLAIAFFD